MHFKANTFIYHLKSEKKNVYLKKITSQRKDVTKEKERLMLASARN